MNSKDEHELAKQHDPNDELEEVEDMDVGDKVGDYRLPACPHSSEPPPAETPVGCKSSDN
jgi:hypothetical protein